MTRDHIIEALKSGEGLPIEAIKAASSQREEMAPFFIEAIEEYLAKEDVQDEDDSLIFFLFHMLGDWGWKPAYPTLARLLQLPPDRLERVFGDAITETAMHVMAKVYDGNPAPLYAVIEAEENDVFIRAAMLEALAIATLIGSHEKRVAARYLQDAFTNLRPRDENFVWYGWQRAIVMLGLSELASLVEKVFQRGWIDPGIMHYEHFQADLEMVLTSPQEWFASCGSSYTPFGETIEELSKWAGFSSQEEQPDNIPSYMLLREPMSRGFPKVGRNEPCPCGSGKKFKKCCLQQAYL